MTNVFVVMEYGNADPSAVFATEKVAKKYLANNGYRKFHDGFYYPKGCKDKSTEMAASISIYQVYG